MTLIELKKTIHEKIEGMDDEAYLDMINAMIDQKDGVFQISEEHLAGIKRGQQEIANSDFITMEQFEKRYEKWLKD